MDNMEHKTVNPEQPRKRRKLSPEEIKKRKRQKMIRRMLPTALAILAVAVIVVVAVALISGGNKSKTTLHHVEIEVKDYGVIKAELDEASAPITVKNFIKLSKKGFYNGLTFHRIKEGFVIQGGDPDKDGNGGSSSNIKGEFAANGVENPLSHVRGVLSMARNSVNMDSASSQFFIVQSDSTFLDGQYAAFGYVTAGMEIVDKICSDITKQEESGVFPKDPNGMIPEAYQPVITAIRVID